MDKIKIDLGFAVLVAEKGIDNNYREIYLSLADKKWCMAARPCDCWTAISL